MHAVIDSFRLTGTGEYRVGEFRIDIVEIHDIPNGASAALQLLNRRARVRFQVGIPCGSPDEAELVVLDRLYNIPTRGTVYFQTGAGEWRKMEQAELRGHPLGYAGGFVSLAYEIEGKVPELLSGGAEPIFASDNAMIVPRTYDLTEGQDYLLVDEESFPSAPTRATANVVLPSAAADGIFCLGHAGKAVTGATFRLSAPVPGPGYQLDVVWYI